MRNELVVGVGTVHNWYYRNNVVKKFRPILRNEDIVAKQIEESKNGLIVFLSLNVYKRIDFAQSLENSICIKTIHIFKHNNIFFNIFEKV